MNEIADIILRAGRGGVELALFVLLPVMVVMLTLMRLLEARGALDWLVKWLAPLLRPFGLPGLGVFAMLQISFVGIAAPVATLSMMDRGGQSSRHIAAVLALVFTMAQANVTLPMAAMGLDFAATVLISLIGGLFAATLTYHYFARQLPDIDELPEPQPGHPSATGTRGVLAIISSAGREAFNIATGAIPMLVLALVMVYAVRATGMIDLLDSLSAPLFESLGLPANLLLPLITKAIAGGTAVMGVLKDYLDQGLISTLALNQLAGLLVHPFDLAGVAILISAGKRVAGALKPAFYGALCGIALRTLLHLLWF
jgi:spore maturation protein SpmB